MTPNNARHNALYRVRHVENCARLARSHVLCAWSCTLLGTLLRAQGALSSRALAAPAPSLVAMQKLYRDIDSSKLGRDREIPIAMEGLGKPVAEKKKKKKKQPSMAIGNSRKSFTTENSLSRHNSSVAPSVVHRAWVVRALMPSYRDIISVSRHKAFRQ